MPPSARRESSFLIAVFLFVFPALAGAESPLLQHAFRQALSAQRALRDGGAAYYNTLLLYEGAGTVLHQAPTTPPPVDAKVVEKMTPQELVGLMRKLALDHGAVMNDPLFGPNSRGIAMTDPYGMRLVFIVPDAESTKLHNFTQFVVVQSQTEFITYVLNADLKFQVGYHVTFVEGEGSSEGKPRSEIHRKPEASDIKNLVKMLDCWRNALIMLATPREKSPDPLPQPSSSPPTV